MCRNYAMLIDQFSPVHQPGLTVDRGILLLALLNADHEWGSGIVGSWESRLVDRSACFLYGQFNEHYGGVATRFRLHDLETGRTAPHHTQSTVVGCMQRTDCCAVGDPGSRDIAGLFARQPSYSVKASRPPSNGLH